MKAKHTLLYGLLLFCASCVKAQERIAGTVALIQPTLIWMAGESNAGGYALNSEALPSELQAQSQVQILNNFTFKYEALKIGVNNKIGHTGHEDSWYTTHGFELQLANRAKYNGLGASQIYAVKTSFGSSKIADWGVGATATYGSYTTRTWDTAQRRVDSAIALLTRQTGVPPRIIICYSQGINDGAGSTPTPVATWKAATIAHFQKIRAKYGNVRIVMTKFKNAEFSAYNAAMDEIAAATPNTYTVDTNSAAMRDQYHWNYAGMKQVADLLINTAFQ